MSFYDFSVKPLTDQFYYLNMARAVLDGYLPYRDFFYAGQPGFLYGLAVFFAFLGTGFGAVGSYLVFFALLGTSAVFLAARRFGEPVGGLAALFFVASEAFFSTASDVNGTLPALALSFLSLFLFFSRRFFSSGLFSCFSVLTRLNSFPTLLVLFFESLRRKEKGFAKACFLVFLVPLVAGVATGGYWGDSVLYHLAKDPLPGLKSLLFEEFFSNHRLFLGVSLVGVFFSFLALYRFESFSSRKILLLFMVVFAANLSYVWLSGVFLYHYFVFLAPFFAFFAAFFCSTVFRNAYGRWRWVSPAIVFVVLFATFLPAYRVLSSDSLPEYSAYSLMQRALERNAEPGDLIMCLSFYNPPSRVVSFLSFLTGIRVPPDYIDSSLFRRHYDLDPVDFAETVEDESSVFFVWELEARDNPSIVGFEELLHDVKANSFVLRSKHGSGNVLLLSSRRPPVDLVSRVSEEPVFSPGETRVYESSVLMGLDEGGPFYSSFLDEASVSGGELDYSRTSFYNYLYGNSPLEQSLLARGHPLLLFPLSGLSRYESSDGVLDSFTWVSGFVNDTWELTTVTYDGEEKTHVSFVLEYYNETLRSLVFLQAYVGVRPSEGREFFVKAFSSELVEGVA